MEKIHKSHIQSLAFLFLVVLTSGSALAQIGGKAGAYSRLGFGARGMGMANALTAVTTGDAVAYYNPAILPSAEYRNVTASFGILSLDRSLNFISYAQPLKPNAGISAGLINSGVSDIDGRNSDGEPTGPLSTSENQVFLGFSTRFQSGLSIGVNFKLLHYRLFTDITSTTVGIDLGVLFPLGESITIGGTARDINSKYTWDTSVLFGQRGATTTEDFPRLYTLGVSYKLPDTLGVVAIDVEISNRKTLTGRIGAEVHLIPELTVRAGVDRIDMKEKGNGIKPTFGFSARTGLGGWTPAVHYAFILEPFAPHPVHMISLSVAF